MTTSSRLLVATLGWNILVAGCEDADADRPALSDWAEGYEATDVGGVAQPSNEPPPVKDAMSFGVHLVDNGVPTRLHQTGTTNDCVMEDLTGKPEGFRSLACTVEMEEFDLHVQGLTFLNQMSAGLCAYIVYWWYQYATRPSGDGPTAVSYTIDASGAFVDEVNSFDGTPLCPYDYRDVGGPNCCEGEYVLTVTNEAGLVATSPPKSWGGRAADCYGGAAFIWPEAEFTEDGWPRSYWEYVNYGEYSRRFEWQQSAQTFRSNLPLANYYRPEDHNGLRPAGLAAPGAVEHYNLVCADHALEWLAHISLTVREWNAQDEFEADGDPESVGLEPSGRPIDDLFDWAAGTPGAASYIGDNE